MTFLKAAEIEADALLSNGGSGAEAVEAFEASGAVVIRGLIGPDWLRLLQDNYDRWTAEAEIPYGYTEGGAQRHFASAEEPAFRDFLFNAPIARAAAKVMRSATAQLYEDVMITEPAGSSIRSFWHQDATNWPLKGRQLSSVWFSLQPVGRETGAMRFVDGSHLHPPYRLSPASLPPGVDPANLPAGEPFPDVDGDPDRFTVLQTEAEPGDAIIFHPAVIHTAYGSAFENRRRSFTIRFMGDDVRWRPRPRLFHAWMHELALAEGDRIVDHRMPVVWAEDP